MGSKNTEIVRLDMEIVGVPKDARYGGVKEQIPPVVYIPYHLQPPVYPVSRMTYELRTAGDPFVYVNTIRAILHRTDKRMPVTDRET